MKEYREREWRLVRRWLELSYGIGRALDAGVAAGCLYERTDSGCYGVGAVAEVTGLGFVDDCWREYATPELLEAGLRPRVFANEDLARAAGLRTRVTAPGKADCYRSVTVLGWLHRGRRRYRCRIEFSRRSLSRLEAFIVKHPEAAKSRFRIVARSEYDSRIGRSLRWMEPEALASQRKD